MKMKMVKYKTDGYGKNLIEEVEVVKETKKQLVIKQYDEWRKKHFETRTAKISSYCQYHDTWEDAHAFLLGKAEKRVESARSALERAILDNIKGLKKPE